MTSRTLYLARLLGLFASILGLAELAQKRSFIETATLLVHDRPLLLVLGMVGLIAGLAMVLAHNIWSGGPVPILVTLFGWIILLRGILLLFLSPEAAAGLLEVVRFEDLFYVYSAITIALGLYLAYAGFSNHPEVPSTRTS